MLNSRPMSQTNMQADEEATAEEQREFFINKESFKTLAQRRANLQAEKRPQTSIGSGVKHHSIHSVKNAGYASFKQYQNIVQ